MSVCPSEHIIDAFFYDQPVSQGQGQRDKISVSVISTEMSWWELSQIFIFIWLLVRVEKIRSQFTSFNFSKIKVGMYYRKGRYVSNFYYFFISVQFWLCYRQKLKNDPKWNWKIGPKNVLWSKTQNWKFITLTLTLSRWPWPPWQADRKKMHLLTQIFVDFDSDNN